MTRQELDATEARVARIKGFPDESMDYYQHDVPELVKTIRKLMALKDKYKKRARFLECLEAAGVDSWEGYEQAQEAFEDE